MSKIIFKPTKILIILSILAITSFTVYSLPTLAKEITEDIRYCNNIKNNPIFDNEVINSDTRYISHAKLKEGLNKISKCAIISFFVLDC